MADGLTTQTAALATIPDATIVATDDCGAAGHVQLMKLALSADGSATPITADSNGLEVQGAGTAGTPAGGVVSVQGVASGTALPVSLASVPSHAVTNAGTFAVQEDGAALTALQLIDDAVASEGDALCKGVLLQGDDGTDRTNVAVDTDGHVQIDVQSSALPTGAATAARQDTGNTSLSSIDGKLPALSGGRVPVDGSGVTQPISHAALTELAAAIDTEVQVDVVAALPAGDNNIGNVDVVTLPALAAGTNNIGDVDVLSLPAIPAGTNNIGDVDVASLPKASGATVSTVADTASSTTLLSSNASRLGASIQNDSSAVLYIKCGTTASATDYSARLVQYAYWEAPFGYTGRIDGIWASDPGDGAARITEFTA